MLKRKTFTLIDLLIVIAIICNGIASGKQQSGGRGKQRISFHFPASFLSVDGASHSA